MSEFHHPRQPEGALTPDERAFVRLRMATLLPPAEELRQAPPDIYDLAEGTAAAHHRLDDQAVTIWGYASPAEDAYEELHIYVSEPIIEEFGTLPYKIISSGYWVIDNDNQTAQDSYHISTRATDINGNDLMESVKSGRVNTDEIIGRMMVRLANVHNKYAMADPHENFPSLADILERLNPSNRILPRR